MVPVPPPVIASVPVKVGVKVKMLEPLSVMVCPKVSPLNARAEEVARVSPPVSAEPYVCLREQPPLFTEEVAVQVGMPF